MIPQRALVKPLTESGEVTTAGVPGMCFGITMVGGTVPCTFALLDGGAIGTEVLGMTTASTSPNGVLPRASREAHFRTPVWFSTDMYGVLTVTGGKLGVPDAVVYVHYAEA